MARHYSVRNVDCEPISVEEFARYRDMSARMEAILDSQPDCVKIVDEEYLIKKMNLAGIEMIDALSTEDIEGKSALNLVDAEYHDLFRETVDAAFAGKGSEIEFTITSLSGVRKRVSQRSAPIFNTDNPNEVMLMVAVTRDITENHNNMVSLEEAKRMAEKANKVKSNFLATMSHEFRTPLNAILGFSEIMKSESFGVVDNPKYAEYINDIHNSGKHLLDLINDVLDISEIEANKRVILKEEINLEEMALHCLGTVNILAEKKNIMVSVNSSGKIPNIFADKRSIKQILINLLSNSVKFSYEGSKITLSISEEDNVVKISIEDEGIGISKEDLAEITEPFFRGQAEAEIAAPGTGLGLSIVQSLLEAHQGTLSIKSKEHIGTIVEITIPVKSED